MSRTSPQSLRQHATILNERFQSIHKDYKEAIDVLNTAELSKLGDKAIDMKYRADTPARAQAELSVYLNEKYPNFVSGSESAAFIDLREELKGLIAESKALLESHNIAYNEQAYATWEDIGKAIGITGGISMYLALLTKVGSIEAVTFAAPMTVFTVIGASALSAGTKAIYRFFNGFTAKENGLTEAQNIEVSELLNEIIQTGENVLGAVSRVEDVLKAF